MLTGIDMALAAQAPLATVTVPLADGSAGARDAGLRQALETALVRASGRVDAAARAAWAPALASPERFVLQSGLVEPPADPLAVPGAAPAARWLRVVFEPRALHAQLQSLELPVWGAQRPELMVWITGSERGAHHVLGSSDFDAAAARRSAGAEAVADPQRAIERELEARLMQFGAALLARAQLRGVPLVLPVLDLLERRQLRPMALWGGFLGGAEQLGGRYGVSDLLWLRLDRTPVGFEVSWRLRGAGLELERVFDCGAVDSCAREALDAVADQLAARLAVTVGGVASRLWLRVDGVREFHQLQSLRALLDGLQGVDTTRLAEVKSDSVLWALTTRAEPARLLAAFAIDGRLRPVERDTGAGPSGRPVMNAGAARPSDRPDLLHLDWHDDPAAILRLGR